MNASRLLLLALPLSLFACAGERIPFDGGMNDMDVSTMDRPNIDVRDVPIMDRVTVDVRDVPVIVDVPRDIPVVRDTGGGGGMCVSSCNMDIECQNSCPAAVSGYENCCSFNVCTQIQGGCMPAQTDGGGLGFDVPLNFDVPILNCLFPQRACTTDNDCTSCGAGFTCQTNILPLPGSPPKVCSNF